MRVADGLNVFMLGSLLCVGLCVGCKEHHDWDDVGAPPDSGTVDSGSSGGADAGKNDSGTADSGASDAGTADSGADGGLANLIVQGMGPWTVYSDPYGDGGANPAMGIVGGATAVRAGDGGMTVTLSVTGLAVARGFGSHVHKLECPPPTSAGGHYQHMPAPDGGANDPEFANPVNEVWLDFTTNDAGVGMGSATVNFVPGTGAAKAIIVHDKLTGDGGLAGPKLACMPLPFP